MFARTYVLIHRDLEQISMTYFKNEQQKCR